MADNEIPKPVKATEDKIEKMLDNLNGANRQFAAGEEGGKKLEKNRYIIIGVIVLVVIGYFVLCERLYNNGSGVDAVRAELTATKEQLVSVQQRLSIAEKGIADSQIRIAGVQKRIDSSLRDVESIEARSDSIEARNNASDDIVRACQQITEQIRARGQSGSKKP